MNKNSLIISKACGKVLIAGGYGVLQQNNYGLSLGLQNFFYSICLQYQPILSTNITIISPQINQLWNYQFKQGITESDGKQNPFVFNAILYTLKYLQNQSTAGRIKILILFDRNFLSEGHLESKCQKFINYQTNYKKTGLGSSACVTVSIIRNLLSVILNKEPSNHLVNCLSQMANLSAQKKIGSNFDISTAVYSTHLYKNVLPKHAFQAIKDGKIKEFLKIEGYQRQFTNKISYYAYIIDLKKGANTRTMVNNFMKNLQQKSQDVQSYFYQQSKQIVLSLFEALEECKEQKQFKTINKKHRKLQQQYSEITDTQIQPKQLRTLLDSLIQIEDTYYAICPGSGGHDAIFLLSSNNNLQKYQSIADNYNGFVNIVNIKWDNQMKVTQQQNAKILDYIQRNKVHQY